MTYYVPLTFFDPTFSKIVDTDYSTYILLYHCEQQWLDFYTAEYFDIYTPTGTISSTLLATVTAKIVSLMTKRPFDTSKLVAAKTANCQL